MRDSRFMQHVTDLATGKAATASVVVGAVLGLTISEWAALATLVFVVLQIIVISPKVFHQLREYAQAVRRWRSKRDSSKSEPPQS